MKKAELLNAIEKEVSAVKNDVIAWRRQFHKCPELGFEEYKTSSKIRSVLKKAGIPFSVMAKTGVVGYIEKGADTTVGLRADMDALPIEEKTGLPFASVNKGVMHACGHDGHAAVLLGVGKVLKKLKKHLNVNVRLIFQPCEEKPPGGAAVMIKEGVLKGIDYLMGFHFFPSMPICKVWFGRGPVMATTDCFHITVKGKGGHGSAPEHTNDPIVCSAAIIDSLQTIISRNVDTLKPAVLSVCKISGGDAYNIIPETVEMTGTVRTLDDMTRKQIKAGMEQKISAIAKAHGCSAKMQYDNYSLLCVNDEKFTACLERLAGEVSHGKNIIDFHPVMGGEDFAFFSQKVPSAYLFVGIGDKYGASHNNNFSIDEKVLPYTVNLFSSLILNFPASL